MATTFPVELPPVIPGRERRCEQTARTGGRSPTSAWEMSTFSAPAPCSNLLKMVQITALPRAASGASPGTAQLAAEATRRAGHRPPGKRGVASTVPTSPGVSKHSRDGESEARHWGWLSWHSTPAAKRSTRGLQPSSAHSQGMTRSRSSAGAWRFLPCHRAAPAPARPAGSRGPACSPRLLPQPCRDVR